MLTKLLLPAVFGVFLLTAATALTSRTTKTSATTRTTSTATVNSVTAATTPLGKVVPEVTRNGNETGSRSRSRSRSASVKDVPIATLATNNSATPDVTELKDGRRAETTTSLLPLQPPPNVTSTTTSTFLTPPSGSTAGKLQLPISAPPQSHSQSQSRATQRSTQKSLTQLGSTKYSSQIRALRQSNVNAEKANLVNNDSNTLQHDSTKEVLADIGQMLPAAVVEVDLEKESKKSTAPSDESGYIHFDVSDDDGTVRGTATPTRATRMETVNEVLSNLFPNGFTDIFRFSYASEQPVPANIVTSDEGVSHKQPTTASPSLEIKLTLAPGSTTTTTTTDNPRDSRANTFFSYETSVSKEYRRELRPGHTEIVVEKLQLLPHGISNNSGEFSDGSNLITKEDLLRINRAAADSPVLPSLLMDPSQENGTATADQPSARQVPIIILNDDDSADMEGISAEDNLIAESQNVGQRVYQRLPVGDKPYGFKIGAQREHLRPESEVNIKIVPEVLPDEESLINQRPIFVAEVQQSAQQTIDGEADASGRASEVVPPSQQLDTFQEHAEQNFRFQNLVQEAPSRKFLRNFNPVLSAGVDTTTPKGSFHYEARGLQPNYHGQAAQMQAAKDEVQTIKREEDSGAYSTKSLSEPTAVGEEHAQTLRVPQHQLNKDAAQLRYFKEQQYLQHQQQVLQHQQQLLLQQQQQEQQRQQHENLIQQQQELQRQEKLLQLHQQQQQQKKKELKQQTLFHPSPQYYQQQQQQQQQQEELYKEIQQPPLSQQYAIFQQHPPPHEYTQRPAKQQQNQYTMQQQQRQKEEEENARKLQHQQQQQQQEEQLKRQQQQAEQQQRLNQQQQQQQQQVSHEQRGEQPQQQQYTNKHNLLEPISKLHTKLTGDSEPASASLNHQTFQHPSQSALQPGLPATPTPHSVVFVTLNTPTSQAARDHSPRPTFTQKSPYEYVSGGTGAATRHSPAVPPTPAAIVKRPKSYTFVEVQKSVNIHNKLITEKDGKLVEEHETIYPLPQYPTPQQRFLVTPPAVQPASAAPSQQIPQSQLPKPAASGPQGHYPLQYSQQLTVLEGDIQPHDYYFAPTEYASLSAHPIHVQHIDTPEQQEEASSYTHDQVVPQLHAQPHVGHEHEHPQQYVQYIEQYIQQPAEQHTQHVQEHQPVEQSQKHVSAQPTMQNVHHPVQEPIPQLHEEHHKPTPDKALTERVVEHQVEKIVERPVHIPYPVHVQQYIDRPYPVQEIIETHIPVPYPVHEPVAVPVHVDRYIDRPYPVEKIVEKRVPYPVEKVVERIVEKEIPIEVEKVVEKVVDRPVPIPIRVPVAIPVPYAHQPLPEYNDHAEIFGAPYHSHPNSVGWPEPTGLNDFGSRSPQIPPKVLQNYYTRMLKKLLPKVLPQRGSSSSATTATTSASYTHTQARPKAPTPSTTTSFKSTKQQKPVTPSSTSGSGKQYSFKIGDMRFDLRPPPPPPTGSEWLQGSRYLYNTIPHDLSAADSSGSEHLDEAYSEPFGTHNEPYDEFQRWRNGHNLKRSPQFGRNLQMEYGFKPPLVPSVEINEQGIPLNADANKADQ